MERPIAISMELYETDPEFLKQFIDAELSDSEISDRHLILYNFATDLIYAKTIQPELFNYLLKYYIQSIVVTQESTNRFAQQICCQFNTALYLNNETIIRSLGIDVYTYIMDVYIQCLISNMEMNLPLTIPSWIAFYNTIVAFQKENLSRILFAIEQANIHAQISYFLFLSVLAFQKEDNFFYMQLKNLYLETDLWEFESECSWKFHWSSETIDYFNKTIDFSYFVTLFHRIKLELMDKIGKEEVVLISQEIEHSETVFIKRKKEYLEKMRSGSSYKYWEDAYTFKNQTK